MAVAHGRVGQKELFLFLHPVGHSLRAFFLKQVSRAIGRFAAFGRRHRGLEIGGRLGAVSRLGMPVDGNVGDIGQDLGAAVLALGELE